MLVDGGKWTTRGIVSSVRAQGNLHWYKIVWISGGPKGEEAGSISSWIKRQDLKKWQAEGTV